ncbi:hypothetical protein KIMH_11450 [Bombiscardovia apis]|uniref:2-amino-4-hydroxy-6-hydroxymethyldihydropteridine diphosphokinase n=1 Tax=Bombiscardovia apis TaxID=2932182 RepID=A0ABM8BDN6_9BIFI|nr:dihydroneopterin aldolase [Bombiscardovia apis]BDR55034.1 hypothetical protein KIMH_11450 [Bombiscardovia apis]
MDSIRLTGIRATPRQLVGQSNCTYLVDATLYLDVNDAAAHDDLTKTVDYAQVVRRIVSLIGSLEVVLLETVAVRVADSILLSHQVRRVQVCVHRLNATQAAGLDIDDVSVTIEREASSQQPVSPAALASGQASEYGRYSSFPLDGSSAGFNGEQDYAQLQATADSDDASHRAVIAMSGNVGRVQDAMRTAIVSLDGVPGSQILGISPLYTREGHGQPDYLCAVVIIETALGPVDMLSALNMIESAHGRSHDLQLPSYPLDLLLVDVDDKAWGIEDMLSDREQALQWATGIADDKLSLPYPQAWQRAEILQPWASIDPEAHLSGTHAGSVAQLAQLAPNADEVTLCSDSWILGGSA